MTTMKNAPENSCAIQFELSLLYEQLQIINGLDRNRLSYRYRRLTPRLPILATQENRTSWIKRCPGDTGSANHTLNAGQMLGGPGTPPEQTEESGNGTDGHRHRNRE